MNQNCEYCGAALPKGVDKSTRRIRSAHFARHALEQRIASEVMTDKQPEALRLADLMREKPDSDGHCMKAATELRRLHALCDEMGEALGEVVEYAKQDGHDWFCLAQADSALAKWKESK